MMESILKASLERQCPVTIMYQKGNVITRRNIEVKSINANQIKAYCHLRKQTRIFNLENILAADYCRKRVLH